MFGQSGERPSEQKCAYEYEGPHEQLQDEQGQGDHNAAAALSGVQWVIGEDRRAAAVVGPKGAGKSTLGFEVCFSMAQREGVGGAGSVRPCYFIHCQEDVRNVPRTVRFVKDVCPPRAGANGPLSSRQGDGWGCKGTRSNNGGVDNAVCMDNGGAMLCDDNAPWDYRVLERVTLKRFSTIENMVWFFANIHTRADHQLPRAIVIDDLHLYPCSPRRDQTSAIAYLLAVIRDAQAHIERRTREPCVVVLTMEAATHCPLPALARQLGAVLRIKQEGLVGGGGNNSPQNNTMAVFSMTEDHGILAGLSPPVPCGGNSSAFMRNNGRNTRSCKTGAPRHIRFALGATVLHVVERSDDEECGRADDCVL